ncbi:Gfo/Idh/MocA family oxidoreductase [bacterium]|nr:Gfo/Idh/MocA family oxidoreductase [bacterium]
MNRKADRKKILFAIIGGAGWRARFYLEIARACPEIFSVTGAVIRNNEKRALFTDEWGIPAYSSIDEMLKKTNYDFVLSSVKGESEQRILIDLAERDVPVLIETPPARDYKTLIDIYAKMKGKKARVQVAEQYTFQPHHAARLAFIKSGVIGTISEARVSVAHAFHAVSLMRHFLGITKECAKISSWSFKPALVQGLSRGEYPEKEEVKNVVENITRYDFGDKMGLIDFTAGQYESWIRSQRVLIRGDRGEIIDYKVNYLKDFLTPVELDFKRHQTGMNGSLEGNYLKGIQIGSEWVYKNPFIPAVMSDEHIAIATAVEKMGEYVHTGKQFYSLAEACQDTYMDLMAQRACKEGKTIETEYQIWSDDL